MDVKALNPEISRYRADEPLGLQVLRARGQEALWELWEDEYQILKRSAAEGRLPEAGFWADPFLLKDMDKAVDCLLPLIKDKAKILIHGDYDCDGITATCLLYRFLKAFDVDVDYFIPDRLNEGYGLTEAGVAYALESDSAALITVDCGVQSFAEVEKLESEGIVVIVTDHHVCLESLPQAHAVINPNRLDEGKIHSSLAGAGVALKLCQALNSRLPIPNLWMSGLEYAALGTVADLMLLEGENRRIVSAGLLLLRKNASVGMQALMEQAHIKIEQLRAKTLSFSIAPRVNACGRMGSVEPIMRLLLSDDYVFCCEQAQLVDKINHERREVETKIYDEALRFFQAHPERLESNVLLAWAESWHHGVLGIVAARLMQYFQRPVIVLSKDSDQFYKGSARSTGGIDILSYLQKCRAFLSHFGGHQSAAGLELPSEEIEKFSHALKEVASDINLAAIKENSRYTLSLTINDLDLGLVDSLDVLEPFGKGNAEPIFYLESAPLCELRAVGKEAEHLRITVEDEKTAARVSGIAFSMANLVSEFQLGETINLLLLLQRNCFRGQETLTFLVNDLEASNAHQDGQTKSTLASELLRLQSLFPTWSAGRLAAPFALNPELLKPTSEALREVYKNLLAAGIENSPLIYGNNGVENLCPPSALEDPRLRLFVAASCLGIYEEAGLLQSFVWKKDPAGNVLLYCYNLQKSKHKVNLYETKTYRRLSQ